jgi:hypothetical protein
MRSIPTGPVDQLISVLQAEKEAFEGAERRRKAREEVRARELKLSCSLVPIVC